MRGPKRNPRRFQAHSEPAGSSRGPTRRACRACFSACRGDCRGPGAAPHRMADCGSAVESKTPPTVDPRSRNRLWAGGNAAPHSSQSAAPRHIAGRLQRFAECATAYCGPAICARVYCGCSTARQPPTRGAICYGPAVDPCEMQRRGAARPRAGRRVERDREGSRGPRRRPPGPWWLWPGPAAPARGTGLCQVRTPQ